MAEPFPLKETQASDPALDPTKTTTFWLFAIAIPGQQGAKNIKFYENINDFENIGRIKIKYTDAIFWLLWQKCLNKQYESYS